jgi:SAM-dependent methyltransferase
MLFKVPPAVSQYRIRRLTKYLGDLIDSKEPLRILDVGCGHAYITRELQKIYPHFTFVGVDVMVRPNSAIEVIEYDGTKLPFEDKSFDVLMLIDMLHHADDPNVVLKECARVAKKFIVIKDHVCDSYFDWLRLSSLDWFGNRPFGIPMTYKYFSSNQWREAFRDAGVECTSLKRWIKVCPAPFHLPFDYNIHLIATLEPKPA